jgi:hypothetical protein
MDATRYAIVSFLKKLESMTAAGGMTPRDRLLATGSEDAGGRVALKWK